MLTRDLFAVANLVAISAARMSYCPKSIGELAFLNRNNIQPCLTAIQPQVVLWFLPTNEQILIRYQYWLLVSFVLSR